MTRAAPSACAAQLLASHACCVTDTCCRMLRIRIHPQSIPDMGYDAMGSPPRGEVLLRGPPIFQSYHKDEVGHVLFCWPGLAKVRLRRPG